MILITENIVTVAINSRSGGINKTAMSWRVSYLYLIVRTLTKFGLLNFKVLYLCMHNSGCFDIPNRKKIMTNMLLGSALFS